MSDTVPVLKDRFVFGDSVVRVLQGDIIAPGVSIDFLVSTDDNYLTMGSGVSSLLRQNAGPEYVAEARSHCPMKAGDVVITRPHGLSKFLPEVRYVLHAAVIDYDSGDVPLEQLVHDATAQCLDEAEKLVRAERLNQGRILFPALATGSGRLPMDVCARQMCSAIKTYLGQESPLKEISIILYQTPEAAGLSGRPDAPVHAPEHAAGQIERGKAADRQTGINQFIKQANLTLDVPFSPTQHPHQLRDVYERSAELQILEDVIMGKAPGKKHAVLLGGPNIGKWVLLQQLFARAQEPGSPLSSDRHLVKVTFGCIHENTRAAFVYQKFLCALGLAEQDDAVKSRIKDVYVDLAHAANPCDARDKFLELLRSPGFPYQHLVFLVDHLPELLDMESTGEGEYEDVRAFWRDIDKLEDHVQFVYTARDDAQYQQLLERLSGRFRDGLQLVRLACLSDDARATWVNQIFERYLDRSAGAEEQRFVAEEAGRHPFLISLATSALIGATRERAIDEVGSKPIGDLLNRTQLCQRQARQTIEHPRRDFFRELMELLDGAQRDELRTLARSVAVDDEIANLHSELASGTAANDPAVTRRLKELADAPCWRNYLHQEILRHLEDMGYVVARGGGGPVTQQTAQFMCQPFHLYVEDFLRTHGWEQGPQRPADLVISLLSMPPGRSGIESARDVSRRADIAASQPANEDDQMIWTMFHVLGARVVTAHRPLSPRIKVEFANCFGQYISHQLHRGQCPSPGDFRDLREIGNYILTQFATVEVRRQLRDLAHGSSVILVIDDALKDIPWELMLETIYTGEIPYRVGRLIVGPRQTQYVRPPVHERGKIRSLLIGNPSGDMDRSGQEVEWLEARLRQDERFAAPVVLVGAEQCRRVHVLSCLGSGDFDLIHFSGHTRFDGERSAWNVGDGDITTDQLTAALQTTPPVMVFSSSCESARAGACKPIEYENQSFDLPTAFLYAGVEAYIGTLWEVLDEPAQRFAEEFYSALLTGEDDLGECMRRAKWACKRQGRWQDSIHWLAFVLYGDPHTMPRDLFADLSPREP